MQDIQGLFSDDFRRYLKTPEEALALQKAYLSADPFPHVSLTGVFRGWVLGSLAGYFPRPNPSWWKYENALERKFAKDRLEDEHPLFQSVIAALQSRPFVDFLEALTGIPGLIVDHSLRGGGLHQIARGGKLDIHADYNVHPVLKLDRRLNVILYLNPIWRPEWRGALELWDRGMTECRRQVLPELGTMVIFSTTDWSWHGHPDPLECDEGTTRKSLALYYYSNGRPEEERSAPHSTIYRARPQDHFDPQKEALREQRAKGRLA